VRSFIARVDATPMSNLVKTDIILKEKLPSIEDRGQADRVTMNATVALPCLNLTHDLDFYPRRAMVMTRRPTHVVIKVSWFKNTTRDAILTCLQKPT